MTEPFVSVVVPVRDGEPHLRDCLASLARLDYPGDRHEVVVVDNGSRDGTARVARELGVRCLHEPAIGAGTARNAGAAAARGEIVAFIDCDCRATTGWLREIADAFADDGAAAVAGEIVAMPPRGGAERYAARRKPLWHAWNTRARGAVHLVGASCAVRRAAFDAVGGFDPHFGSACEDIDLSLRLRRAGLEIRRAPRALVFHRNRGTVRGLAAQQFGYARRQALLVRRYPDEFPWGLRAEARAWAELGRCALRLARAVTRREAGAEHQALDLVRRAAQRLGFARGMLAAAAPRSRR